MSTDNERPTEEKSADEQEPDGSSESRLGRKYSTTYQTKVAVHERDRRTCICCRESFKDISELDVDHILAEGKGGPNTVRNKGSLCRRCHEAKHGERDHAPTIRCMSTGDMCEKDFRLYRHFWNQQLPAMSEIVLDHRVKPKFDLADEAPYRAWHVPVGEVRRLDEVLADIDEVTYAPLRAEHYM